MRQPEKRTYGESDIKVLMNNTSAWARDWDDLLHYLEDTGDVALNAVEVPRLIEDVKHLKEDDVRFTTDYRELWQELTGNGMADDARRPATGGRNSPAPQSRVQDVLRRVNSPEYRQMSASLQWEQKDEQAH